ncbi:MAG: AAA family ATPase [Anaerolineales bacterium]|nr:AAA family ATPase [Anaerolineales bacterium]
MTITFDEPVTCPVLIGRTRELAALYSLIDLARSGRGRVALIRGEAGIGKSRLVAAAKSSALTQGFLILQGDCFQADTSYPYAPLLDLLRALFTSRFPTPLAADQGSFVSEFVRLLPDLELLFPDLAPLPLTQTLDPEQQKRRLFTVLTRFFTTQSAQQPVLLIVEDLHWCDESSLELLLYLARHCKSQPLCFLFTYRSEDISPSLRHWLAELDRERLALELILERLSDIDVDAMLQAIFDAPHPVHTELLNTICTLAEGNPFFVEELLKSLISTGELHYVDGTWERRSDQRDPGGLSLVPRSVHDAVKQRVDRLSAAAKQALTLAAVAGRRYDFAMLQQVLNCNEDYLLALTKELIAAQLIIEESADQFAFRHALGQQAIYRSLLARERKSLHRAIAEALESLYPSPTLREAHLVDLASHFFEAGDWVKALEYEQRAGERALALNAPGAAIEHLTRALEAAHQLHLTPPSKVYHARGQAYATVGEFDRAREDYERAFDTARSTPDGLMEWQSMMALGFLWAGRDYAQAGAWFRNASDQASHLADPTLRARSLNRLGNWLLNTGRIEEGLQAHQEALEIFEEQQNTQGIAETLDLLGITYGMRGDRVKAVEQLGRAITLFRTQGDTQSLVSSLAMRALQSMPGASETTLCPLRTKDDCVRDASEALRLARQIDSPAGQAFAENALAHTLLSFGEFSPALSHAQEAQRIAREIGHQQWMVAAYHCLGHIYRLLLSPDPALTTLEVGLSLAKELGSAFWIATLAANLGLAYVLKRNLPAAQATLQTIMSREQTPQNVAERDVTLAWGELALAQGEPAVALQIADHLLASAPGKAPGQPIQPIPHLLKLRGEALFSLSHLDEALDALEDARRGAQERNAQPVLWTIHRALGQVNQALQLKDQARQERAAARQNIEELAATIDEDAQRDQFTRAALGTFPQEKPLLPREAAKRTFGGLTMRECEVAALIAEGKTSREIANLLVVTERTAEVHVSNILRKLEFTSRAQIAVWAVEKGLVKR